MIARKLAILAFMASASVASAQSTQVSQPLMGYNCQQDCAFDPFCWFWQHMTCPPTVPDGLTKNAQPLATKDR